LTQPPGQRWLRTLLGSDFFEEVISVWYIGPEATDVDLARLKGLTQLQDLILAATKITDAGLGNLKGLTQLQELNLNGTEITDAGLENLRGLTQLQVLTLKRTRVTDAGVEKLRQSLPKCKISLT
jgi:Leucine-rich repeat (LRR) protein